MDNLAIYNKVAEVPETAKKKINGGKLSGMTDINPMWRVKTLTEIFGPCGIGWYTKTMEHWVEREDSESSAWVRIELYVKFPDTKEWSAPIEGIGGSKQCGKGTGVGINDEAFKMAETDALSVACKKLGIGAKVYWEKDNTKYTSAVEPKTKAQSPTPSPKTEAEDDGLEKLALDDAIADVKAAKTPEELTKAWNRWKYAFGDNATLRMAIAQSPANPKNGRSNG